MPEKQKVAQDGKVPDRSDLVRLDVIDNDQGPKANGGGEAQVHCPIDLVIGSYLGPVLLLSLAIMDVSHNIGGGVFENPGRFDSGYSTSG